LYTLCRHSPTNDIALPVAYYQTIQPCIRSSKVMEAYFLILCRASITEAFYFSRTQGDLNHRFLFGKLITFVHSKSVGKIKATRGAELIGLPLNQEEETWFTEFLTQGRGSMLSGAADTLMMRAIAIERPIPDAQYRRMTSGEKIDGVSWEIVRSSA